MNCPFVSSPVHSPRDDMYVQHDVVWVDCPQSNCQLWTMAKTTEDQPYYNCAFVINALKNSAGKIAI